MALDDAILTVSFVVHVASVVISRGQNCVQGSNAVTNVMANSTVHYLMVDGREDLKGDMCMMVLWKNYLIPNVLLMMCLLCIIALMLMMFSRMMNISTMVC